MAGERWTREQEEYLRKYYKTRSIKHLMKVLGKSKAAIVTKAKRMKITSSRDTGHISAKQLGELLNVDRHIVVEWIKNKHLKAHKRAGQWCIEPIVFWKFAKTTSIYVPIHRIEKNMLGKEPKWADELREKSKLLERSNYPWTPREDEILKTYYFNMDIEELSLLLKRTPLAIRKRARQFKMLERPIYIAWKPIEVTLLLELVLLGCNNVIIAEALGRTESMVNNKKTKLAKKQILIYKKGRYYRGSKWRERNVA